MIHLLKYINGILINPTIHFNVIWPIIKGKIGLTPKKARGIKISVSNNNAGRELKAFLVHKYLPLVSLLNQENTIASKFSEIKNAAHPAKVILGTKPNICFHTSCKFQKGAGWN